MSNPNERFPSIPVLWFDKTGGGPSELSFKLRSFVDEFSSGNGIGDHIGIQVRHEGGLVSGRADELVEAGFFLGREQAETLHRQLTEWLADPAGAK